MESYIPISFLNDFIFCPRSIYFHQLYGNREQVTYQNRTQIEGRQAHRTIDEKKYSTRKEILQGLSVYSDKYNIHGKIDTFDTKSGVLIERKKLIKNIYDGYVFQLYAQYYCLIEMGYVVKRLRLYSMDTNKSYPIPLPKEDLNMKNNFLELINKINKFDLRDHFQANPNKCIHCIYSSLCDQRAEPC